MMCKELMVKITKKSIKDVDGWEIGTLSDIYEFHKKYPQVADSELQKILYSYEMANDEKKDEIDHCSCSDDRPFRLLFRGLEKLVFDKGWEIKVEYR